jgi:O-antigen ligase
MIVPIAVVSLWKFREIGWKVAALAVVGAMLALMMLSSELITVRVHHRNFTSDQALENLGSILGAGHENGTEGTKEWRLIWWGEIIRYTVFGPYRWTGKGFGINLAQEDGPPGISKEDTALRSPHNGSMTVLARMGIPGLAIWAALNLVFVLRLLRAHRVASRAGSRFWSGVNLWILCYWLAAFINMSFDVYLEGPQGGIWFWSIIGFGVAAMRIQSYEARRARLQMELDALGLSDTEHALAPA